MWLLPYDSDCALADGRYFGSVPQLWTNGNLTGRSDFCSTGTTVGRTTCGSGTTALVATCPDARDARRISRSRNAIASGKHGSAT